MKLGAVLIENHHYLTYKPELITFGTKFNYQLKFVDENLNLFITDNDEYIEDFFNVTSNKITNISSIVGKNGYGKTTILNIIRSVINQDYNKNYEYNSLVIIEDNEKPLIYHKNLNRELNIFYNNSKYNIEDNFKKVNSIYYSPIFNYQLINQNDKDDSFDISFDYLLHKDLTKNNLINNIVNSSDFNPNEELSINNSFRQLNFLNSKIFKKNEILRSFFNIENPNLYKIYVRGYKNETKDWNTPSSFRPILNFLDKKIKKEINEWDKIRKMNGRLVENQIDINKYLLKRYSLRDFLSVLFKKFEEKNTFLNEGYIEFEEKEFLNKSALEIFQYFIKNASIKLNGSIKKIFNSKESIQLLKHLYLIIDKVTDERLVQNEYVYANYEDIIKLLHLQKSFINDLTNYFYLFYKESEDEFELSDRVENFIHFYPSDNNLSSGQHSLLNIFSRFYECLNNIKKRKISDHYIFLIDEGDLTFHPEWKRKYVNNLLKFIPLILSDFSKKSTIEIIITTHDPLTLSDLPRNNVIFLDKVKIQKRKEYYKEEVFENVEKMVVLEKDSLHIPQKTFSANISEILSNSYFLEDGLIGDFAYDKINDVINWLNNEDDLENHKYYEKVIQIIDEPIVKMKLSEMYDEKMNSNIQIALIDKEIEKLKKLKKDLIK